MPHIYDFRNSVEFLKGESREKYPKEFFDYLPKWVIEDAERAGVPAHIIKPLVAAAEEICFKLMVLETSYRTGYLNEMSGPEEVYEYLKRITNGVKFGGEE